MSRAVKFIVFALIPLFLLLAAGEAIVRVKYFFAHGRDWKYLTRRGPSGSPERWMSPREQMVFPWAKPCTDTMVFSVQAHANLPRTFDKNCFRGDHIASNRAPGEYRVMFVGGSTVEDQQSDDDMMTAQFKCALARTHTGEHLTVVNAGRVGFESGRILLFWDTTLFRFSPNLLLYYEAWNEQPTNVAWSRADDRLASFHSRIHRALYNRWSLYTYLVEKYVFLTTDREYFWKTDLNDLERHFLPLVEHVQALGTEFVFVTQVVNFPRIWKGVDTFDYRAVDGLLDRLKSDRRYMYDAVEISALNQRRTLMRTVELCRDRGVRVLNILDAIEALGDSGRAAIFGDLGHLTVQGDHVIGELIATKLTEQN